MSVGPAPDTFSNVPSAELSVSARDWIDHRIRTEFDRDRQYLKDLGGLAAKVIWGAISAVTIIVAIAGFRTYREVSTAIVSAAERQVSAALKAEDPNSPFTQTRDQLVNQAIIDSYLVRLTRAESSETGDIVFADELHRTRMRRLLENEKTDADVFRDALRVYTLVDTDDEDIANQTFGLLREMLTAREQYAWLRQDKTRRVAILNSLDSAEQHEYAKPGIAAILRDTDLPEEIVSAALRVAIAHPSEDYLEPLKMRCAKKTVEPRAHAALAAVDPGAVEVNTFVDNVLSDDDALEANRAATLYVLEAWLNHEKLPKDLKPRAVDLLARAVVKGGLTFVIPADDDDEAPIIARSATAGFRVARSALLGDAGREIVKQAMNEAVAAKDDRAVRRYIQAFTYERDARHMVIPSFRMRPRLSFVTADLTGGGKLVATDGREIASPGPVLFSVGPRGEIIARWRENEVPASTVVREFRNIDLIALSFEEPSEEIATTAPSAVARM